MDTLWLSRQKKKIERKRKITLFFSIILFLVALDLIILFASLAQIGLEGKTGYWSPFWRVQAEQVIKILQVAKK